MDEVKREDVKEIWSAINQTNNTVSTLAQTVAVINGKIVGWTTAAVLAGTIIAFIANKVFH